MWLEDSTEGVNMNGRQGNWGLNSRKDEKGVWEGLASEVSGDQKRGWPRSQVKKVEKKEGINMASAAKRTSQKKAED